jgi:hypothetical protein
MKHVFLATAIALMGATGSGSLPSPSQYLMSPSKEIALARTAAPASISDHATILTLTANGLTQAVRGDNGFTCYVDWNWMHQNIPLYWNTMVKSPVCFNAAGSQTVLLYTLKRTKLALSGMTEEKIIKVMDDAIASKELPPAAPDSIAYMMSKQQCIDMASKAWYPHLMFFMPMSDSAKVGLSWGADRRLSPVVFDPHQDRLHDPWAKFFIPVTHWSDGSPAPLWSGT